MSSPKAVTPVAIASGGGHTIWASSNPAVADAQIVSINDFLSNIAGSFNHGDSIFLTTRNSWTHYVISVPKQLSPPLNLPISYAKVGTTAIA